MKAKIIDGQAPGGARTKLADALPLETPYVVQIFPVYACNFKCRYCLFSTPKAARYFISDTAIMDYGLYRKCIDGLAAFPEQVKVLRFVGIGEPLLHKKIADMVAYAVSRKVARTVEILTNGLLLTPALSTALVRGGLTRLVVSLQGTSAEKYREISQTAIDFPALVENLRYFYQHKEQAQVYIKIIDCALDGPEDRQKFYGLFGDLCDTMAVEQAVPIHTGVDFERVLKDRNSAVTQFGLPVTPVRICPQPFFTMQINPDGKVVPCYSFEYPRIVGDCRQRSLREIWKGPEFQAFRRAMLDGLENAGDVCRRCSIITYRLFPEDNLNGEAARLKPLYAT